MPESESPIVGAVLAWYAEAARVLPWREPTAPPWAVLVSEIMLQQTPVSRVLPAYADWLIRWPTPAALAAATPGDAVRAWGRLGYPRRALRLRQVGLREGGRESEGRQGRAQDLHARSPRGRRPQLRRRM